MPCTAQTSRLKSLENMMQPRRATLLFIIIALPLFAQGFWEQTQGPYSGNVYALAIDNNGQIFAGTNGGVFRSADNGEIWTRSLAGMTTITTVSCLVLSPTGTLLAGTEAEGIYRSTDNGNQWTRSNSGL